MDASLDGWLTEGRFAGRFARRVRARGRAASASLPGGLGLAGEPAGRGGRLLARCTSGRSRPGDEVITPALGFSTTVAPLYQYGLVPVYVDVELDTLNPSLDAFADAIGERTRGGDGRALPRQPVRRRRAGRSCARERGLVLIEDCCDALGSTLGGRPVGTFGARRHLLVLSRPPHDDGRGRRGGGRRPRLGARARLAARVGPRLLVPARRERRVRAPLRGPVRRAARGLRPQVRVLAARLQLQDHGHAGGARAGAARPAGGVPRSAGAPTSRASTRRSPTWTTSCCGSRATDGADPSWFGYPFTLREGGAKRRTALQRFLLERRIDSRLLLGGNLTRQPALQGLDHRDRRLAVERRTG